ncbi:MAG TPA: response regulator, partial [Burkholderiaceae bacterium]|nr:response regulator [Burkholderiaceae bacterium]
ESVFIVEDDASVRDSLSLLLSLHGYLTATFGSAEDFLAAYKPGWRGCLIVDVRMPGMSGLELQKTLQDNGANLRVVVITAHGDVAAARQAFLAHAVDFIEKPFEAQQLLAAVAVAHQGLRPQAGVAPPPAPERLPVGRLSAREREVMRLMVQGMHNRHMAEALGISPRTVEVHKARVMEKLQVRNIVELVRLVDQGEV